MRCRGGVVGLQCVEAGGIDGEERRDASVVALVKLTHDLVAGVADDAEVEVAAAAAVGQGDGDGHLGPLREGRDDHFAETEVTHGVDGGVAREVDPSCRCGRIVDAEIDGVEGHLNGLAQQRPLVAGRHVEDGQVGAGQCGGDRQLEGVDIAVFGAPSRDLEEVVAPLRRRQVGDLLDVAVALRAVEDGGTVGAVEHHVEVAAGVVEERLHAERLAAEEGHRVPLDGRKTHRQLGVGALRGVEVEGTDRRLVGLVGVFGAGADGARNLQRPLVDKEVVGLVDLHDRAGRIGDGEHPVVAYKGGADGRGNSLKCHAARGLDGGETELREEDVVRVGQVIGAQEDAKFRGRAAVRAIVADLERDRQFTLVVDRLSRKRQAVDAEVDARLSRHHNLPLGAGRVVAVVGLGDGEIRVAVEEGEVGACLEEAGDDGLAEEVDRGAGCKRLHGEGLEHGVGAGVELIVGGEEGAAEELVGDVAGSNIGDGRGDVDGAIEEGVGRRDHEVAHGDVGAGKLLIGNDDGAAGCRVVALDDLVDDGAAVGPDDHIVVPELCDGRVHGSRKAPQLVGAAGEDGGDVALSEQPVGLVPDGVAAEPNVELEEDRRSGAEVIEHRVDDDVAQGVGAGRPHGYVADTEIGAR